MSCNSLPNDYNDYIKIDYITHDNLIKSEVSSYNNEGYSENFHMEGNKNSYAIGLPVEFINKIIIYKNKRHFKLRNKDYYIQKNRFFLFFKRNNNERIEFFVTDKKIKFLINIENDYKLYILDEKGSNWLLNLW